MIELRLYQNKTINVLQNINKNNINTMSTYSVYNLNIDNNLTFQPNQRSGNVLTVNEDGSTNFLDIMNSWTNGSISYFTHCGNNSVMTAPSLTAIGFTSIVEGTATTRSVSPIYGIQQRLRRISFQTTAAINLSAGVRVSYLCFSGDSTTKGGFYFSSRFGYTVANSANRGFVGMSSNATFTTTTDFSTGIRNGVGFGYDAADTNWQIFSSDATVPCFKLDTGIPKPYAAGVTGVANSAYDVSIFNDEDSTDYMMSITDLSTGSSYSKTLTPSDTLKLPGVNTMLAPRVITNTGSSASIAAIDISNMYMKCNY